MGLSVVSIARLLIAGSVTVLGNTGCAVCKCIILGLVVVAGVSTVDEQLLSLDGGSVRLVEPESRSVLLRIDVFSDELRVLPESEVRVAARSGTDA